MQRQTAAETGRPARWPGMSWIVDHWRRLAARNEWDALSAEERGRIAQDLAVTEWDMTALVRDGGGCAELDVVLRRTGLTGMMPQSALRDMQRVCALCPQRARCRAWLAAAGSDAVPSFCPNRSELSALREA